jgi:hypothetical protein
VILDRKRLIGNKFPIIIFKVLKDEVQDFLKIVEEPLIDGKICEGKEIPLSFYPIVGLSFLKAIDLGKELMADWAKDTIMHGEQGFEHYRPLLIGETLRIEGEITDVYEKKGKRPFDVITIESIGKDGKGTKVFLSRSVILIFK